MPFDGDVLLRMIMGTEGEAIVFRPDGKGGYRLVGQLTALQWGDLVRDLVILKLNHVRFESSSSRGLGLGGPAPI